MEIYVGNLAWSASEQELADNFGEYGTVEKATIIVDRDSGRSRGFGFVTMNDNEQGNAAIEALNGVELGGRALKVNEARPREERPPRRERQDDW
ncbi:MAG: RNA-binding protein [Opitutales bacterium]